jgi:5-methylcytosine-specific restriction endonuclease McrA
MTRREFPEAIKRAIRARSGGVCECRLMPADIAHLFPKECDRPAAEIDHRIAECLRTEAELLEPLTAEDGAHLCSPCHKLKTASDQAMRGKRNAHRVRDDPPKRAKASGKPRLQSRGFDKTLRRKMDGTVERRET